MKARTIESLGNLKGRVYVYIPDAEIGKAFMKQAESEGYIFKDGAKPTQRCAGYVMAVNRDKTINFIGFTGMAAFGCKADKIGEENLIRVDFKKYIEGEEDYIL